MWLTQSLLTQASSQRQILVSFPWPDSARLCGQQQPLVFVGLVIECLLCRILYGPPGTLSQWDYFLHLADKETERLETMSSGEDRWQEVLVPGDLGARCPWSPIRVLAESFPNFRLNSQSLSKSHAKWTDIHLLGPRLTGPDHCVHGVCARVLVCVHMCICVFTASTSLGRRLLTVSIPHWRSHCSLSPLRRLMYKQTGGEARLGSRKEEGKVRKSVKACLEKGRTQVCILSTTGKKPIIRAWQCCVITTLRRKRREDPWSSLASLSG